MNDQKIPDKNADTSEPEWVNRTSDWLTAGRSTILLVVLILLYAYIPVSQEFQIKGLEFIFVGIMGRGINQSSYLYTHKLISVRRLYLKTCAQSGYYYQLLYLKQH